MKHFKYMIGLYCIIIATIISIVVISCTSNNHQVYYFDINKPNYENALSKDKVDSLFNEGITVCTFENHSYYIQNTVDNLLINKDDYEVIDFGPLTIDRDRNEDINNFCELTVINNENGTSDVTLKVRMISKFQGKIYRIDLNPAWVSFDTEKGLCGVNLLKELVYTSTQGVEYGEELEFNIPWRTQHRLIQDDPLEVSIRIDCYFDNLSDNYFSEVVRLSVNNHRNNTY